MMKLAMSPAAAGLLRALLDRAGVDRDRILLTEFRSTDWRSLVLIREMRAQARTFKLWHGTGCWLYCCGQLPNLCC